MDAIMEQMGVKEETEEVKNDDIVEESGVVEEEAAPPDDSEEAVDEGEEEPSPEESAEGEPEAEEEAEPEEEAAGEVPAIPTELLLEAGRMGFSKEDIQDFGTEGALKAAMRREAARAEATEQQAGKGEAKAGSPAKKFEVKLWDEAEEKKLLDEGFDPALVNGLKARFAVAEQGIAGLHAELTSKIAAVEGILMSRDQAEYTDWFDESCDKLGKEWAKVVGEAGSKNRHKVAETLARLAKPELESGKPLSKAKRKELFQQAIQVAFPKTSQKLQNRANVRKSDDRARMQHPGMEENRASASDDAEADRRGEEAYAKWQKQNSRTSSGFFDRLISMGKKKKG